MPDAPLSDVHSPAGAYLVSGLLAPYLTVPGRDELARRWASRPDDLAADVRAVTTRLAVDPALRAALGVWTRDHEVPEPARRALGDHLRALPLDPAAAQVVLDRWAALHTHDLIETFPLVVTDSTHCVLASAVALEDTWARPATRVRTTFRRDPTGPAGPAGDPRPGLDAPTHPTRALASDDSTAVRVTLPLTSGAEVTFCLAEGATVRSSLDLALRLLDDPAVFTTPVGDALASRRPPAWVTSRATTGDPADVAVVLPEFTTRSTRDLLAEPAAWGLETALDQGVPGLGAPGVPLLITDARQDAVVEVTHTGVRAAAVTAVAMSRSARLAPPRTGVQAVVTLDRPFAYRITHPDLPVPLFSGTYAG